ncbi:MAG: C4-dicarboxylate ABC transporter [Methylovulum sp.]|nr:C4-dicarboxylate ABC transporter [Methylovulum sp.]
MIKPLLCIIFVLMPVKTRAGLSLHIDRITTANWNVQDLDISLTGPTQSQQQLALTIARLKLPEPFNDLSQVKIRCDPFSLQNHTLLCPTGRAEAHTPRWQSPTADFSLHISEHLGNLTVSKLRLADGTLAVTAEQRDGQWQLHSTARSISGGYVQRAWQPKDFALKNGQFSFTLKASGNGAQPRSVDLSTRIDALSGQTSDGRYAAENLGITATLHARFDQELWHWQQQIRSKGGAFYAEPLYLDTHTQTMIGDAKGDWHPLAKTLTISSARYRHGKAVSLAGTAHMQYAQGFTIAKASLSLHSEDLQLLSATYLKPLLEQTAWEGLSFAGSAHADITVRKNELSALTATVKQLVVNDPRQHITANGGTGTVYWSKDKTSPKPSNLAWQQLTLGKLPIGPSRLRFLARNQQIGLLEPVTAPFLGGTITINQFSWKAKPQQEPEIFFTGSINNVSLEQLSLALNWTPLSGNINGTIPKVRYRNNTLSLDGEIVVNVFDGTVKITNLASSDLFSGYPKLYSELWIDNLDLDQLTQKFEFGGITGKLSGYVRQLTLENWRPVSFFAWLGTPDNDNSSHRISQKAVKNIANIGGGGASDLVSRSFLSLFKTFGYDKLGLGCYLSNGVCQLMGVDSQSSGYRIIKGGGLPRIDVIGYNPRVDWNVLMERLSHISTTDEIRIE